MSRALTRRRRPAVHGRALALRRSVIGCLLAAFGTACGSNGATTSADGGTLTAGSSGMALSERANSLAMTNHATQCSFCACKPLVPPNATCQAAMLDSFPPAKRMIICEIAAAERAEACLDLAQTCDDVQKCGAVEQSDTAKCPTFDPLQLPPPPSGC